MICEREIYKLFVYGDNLCVIPFKGNMIFGIDKQGFMLFPIIKLFSDYQQGVLHTYQDNIRGIKPIGNKEFIYYSLFDGNIVELSLDTRDKKIFNSNIDALSKEVIKKIFVTRFTRKPLYENGHYGLSQFIHLMGEADEKC